MSILIKTQWYVYFFPNEFDYINLFDYLSNWKSNQIKQKIDHVGQNNLNEVGHLIKFNKTKWHVWSNDQWVLIKLDILIC
jgi:hypothetical protein